MAAQFLDAGCDLPVSRREIVRFHHASGPEFAILIGSCHH